MILNQITCHTLYPIWPPRLEYYKASSKRAYNCHGNQENAILHGNTASYCPLIDQSYCNMTCSILSCFTAVPTISADVTITVDVFDGGTTELTCPFPLGALAKHLDPYTFSWETINIQGFSIPVLPSPSSQYSNNNRTLTILVDGSTRDSFYHCVLLLRRCDITRSDGSLRCPAMTYGGPLNRFAVLGKDNYS